MLKIDDSEPAMSVSRQSLASHCENLQSPPPRHSMNMRRVSKRRATCRLGDDAVRDGLADGLGLGMHVQFIVDAADVVSDGVDADLEAIGGRLVAITLGQHP